jgi:hypothetical protein
MQGSKDRQRHTGSASCYFRAQRTICTQANKSSETLKWNTACIHLPVRKQSKSRPGMIARGEEQNGAVGVDMGVARKL